LEGIRSSLLSTEGDEQQQLRLSNQHFELGSRKSVDGFGMKCVPLIEMPDCPGFFYDWEEGAECLLVTLFESLASLVSSSQSQ
jgi:hypothetical protein